MNISAKTDYAIRAMAILADADLRGSGPISVDALATQQDLPRKFLEAIFADLRRAGLVRSTRGTHGGYALALGSAETSLGAIVRAVDGPLAEVRGLRPHETEYQGVASSLPTVYVAMRVGLRRVLDETSLADLVRDDLPAHVTELADEPDAWQNR